MPKHVDIASVAVINFYSCILQKKNIPLRILNLLFRKLSNQKFIAFAIAKICNCSLGPYFYDNSLQCFAVRCPEYGFTELDYCQRTCKICRISNKQFFARCILFSRKEIYLDLDSLLEHPKKLEHTTDFIY